MIDKKRIWIGTIVVITVISVVLLAVWYIGSQPQTLVLSTGADPSITAEVLQIYEQTDKLKSLVPVEASGFTVKYVADNMQFHVIFQEEKTTNKQSFQDWLATQELTAIPKFKFKYYLITDVSDSTE